MKYYISDTHFGHYNVIKLCNRPFETVAEMDETLIKKWNSRVGANDEIYIMGDMFYGKGIRPIDYLKRLNGIKHLIKGNHDSFIKDNECEKVFASINDYLDISDEGRRCILFHYPILSWNGMYRQSYHIYGHIHKSLANYLRHERALHAGVDINNFEPKTLDELIKSNLEYREEIEQNEDIII